MKKCVQRPNLYRNLTSLPEYHQRTIIALAEELRKNESYLKDREKEIQQQAQLFSQRVVMRNEVANEVESIRKSLEFYIGNSTGTRDTEVIKKVIEEAKNGCMTEH